MYKFAVIGIFIRDMSKISLVNERLHEYAEYIVGRLGIPYREKNINIISVIVHAPADTISTLSGKLGNINGVTAKAMQTAAD